MASDLYLGLDLSTQSLTLVFVEAGSKRVVHVDCVHFDEDLPQFGTRNGMHVAPHGGRVTSPVTMWLEAFDVIMLRQPAELMQRVVGVSGSAQQHGSVYWSGEGVQNLQRMNPELNLVQNLPYAFTLEDSPIWADSSTQFECDAMEAAAGGAQVVANLTGSRCYCRFTGPQIAKLARVDPQRYARTERISLVSGFLTSLLLGRVAPTDVSDASGMNLLDIWAGDWSEDMLLATRAPELRRRLGRVVPSWEVLGPVSPYASSRYHLPRNAVVVPASGDNPCSLSASPDAPIVGNGSNGLLVVSLGTSDTLIGLTRKPVARTEGHVMMSPRGPGEYFVMLCYKNGAVAREMVRDSAAGGDWGRFSELLRESRPGNGGKLGLYLAMEEIIPVLPYRGIYRVDEQDQRVQAFDPATEVRAVVEARFLSMRAHAAAMGISRPTRIVATGGGSKNAEMMQVLADVFGVEVYRSDVSNSAAVGAALRAEHAVSCRRAGGWHEFDTAALASGLKLVASPSLNGAQAYDDKLVSRFAAFERAGHQSQVERKV